MSTLSTLVPANLVIVLDRDNLSVAMGCSCGSVLVRRFEPEPHFETCRTPFGTPCLALPATTLSFQRVCAAFASR